jgi:hypothetical protein
MFNITDNFQPMSDEQLTEVTGGILGTVVSSVPVAGPLTGPTVTSLGLSSSKLLTDTNTTVVNTTTPLTNGLGTILTDVTA